MAKTLTVEAAWQAVEAPARERAAAAERAADAARQRDQAGLVGVAEAFLRNLAPAVAAAAAWARPRDEMRGTRRARAYSADVQAALGHVTQARAKVEDLAAQAKAVTAVRDELAGPALTPERLAALSQQLDAWAPPTNPTALEQAVARAWRDAEGRAVAARDALAEVAAELAADRGWLEAAR